MALIEGIAQFSHLVQTEEYNGQDTNKFSLTITVDEDSADMLQKSGVKLRTYEGQSQRKFASKFPVKIVDVNDQPFIGNVTRGSKVRLQYKEGPQHPVHGTSTYLTAVRVLELAEESSGSEEGF